jgi:hypothetical protein
VAFSITFKSMTLLATAAAIGIAYAAPADQKQAQARIVEEEKYGCPNCFFGGSDYFFCFEADNQILVAHDKIPTLNWTDPNKNYLVKLHKSWKAPAPSGDSIKIQYDDKHVWIPRDDGKQIRMSREVDHNPFTNARCSGAVKKASGD